jgi:glycosyltransferase involved in cell wall biosynthesis
MPCYNAAETVDDAVQSILNQSFENFELIAVDDGSTDATLLKLQSFADRDKRIRIHECPHMGVIKASNVGLAAATAPIIARMDADDISRPERLTKQFDLLESNPEIAVVSCLVEGYPPDDVGEGYKIYFEWLNSLKTPHEIARELYIESPLPHPTIMAQKSWVENVGGYQDYGWPEDYDLLLRLHLAGAKFVKVPEVLLYWREHPNRLTRTDPRYSVENFLRAKAHYLCQDVLKGTDALIIWGAGQMGRRISKHLLREGAPLVAFIDIDPKKIGRSRRSRPIYATSDLKMLWEQFETPVLLAAVRSRGARALIRDRIVAMGFVEGQDWWAVA